MPLNPRFAEPRVEWRDSHPEHESNPALAAVKSGSGKAAMALIGRLLIAAIFLMSGIAKLTDLPGTVAHMTKMGIPYADTLATVAGVAEILGAASLILGLLTRVGALGLILFLIPATLIFHAFWNYQGAEQLTQMVNFMKNLAIMGGLATLVAVGALRFSVDHRIRRRHHRSIE
jgi:putative oxidoreductase